MLTLHSRSVPGPVNGLGAGAGVSNIASGPFHSCAVVAGAAKCWGNNLGGQLGDGTNTQANAPVGVTGLQSGVLAVAAGLYRSCALRAGGGIKCWGSGLLGDGTFNGSLAPVDVIGLHSGAQAVALGNAHGCAIDAAGGVRCWGFNHQGEIGDGTASIRTAPVPVVGLASGVVRIAIGASHSCALLATGTVKCWGAGGAGQLGPLAAYQSSTPVVVPLPAAAIDVTAGESHTCAILAGGVAKCWGLTHDGQLGTGDAPRSAEPRTVVVADFTTTATLTSSPNPSVHGSPVTLTGTLTSRDTVPNALVRLDDGGHPLACGGGPAPNIVTCQVFPTPGVHRFSMRFDGDSQHLPATATVVHTVTSVAGEHCAGFDDVDAAHPLCRNVDWVRNRNITLGCGVFDFCPSAVVSRLSMAAFMNRLGHALSPEVVYANPTGGFYLASGFAACATPQISPADHPRRATIDAVVSALLPGDYEIGVQIVSGHPYAVQPVGVLHRLFVPSDRFSSMRVSATVDIPAGHQPAFGVRLSRFSDGVDALSDGRCTVRGVVFNRDETFVPYDAGN